MRRAILLPAIGLLITACALAGDDERRRLADPTTIGGLRCERYAWVTADGRLESCFLADDSVIDGQRLPRHTRVTLAAHGGLDWVFLPETTEIQGHACRGRGHSFMTGFHPGGRLKLCWLAENESIHGIPCQRTSLPGEMFGGLFGAPNSAVRFHPDGSLAGCKLASAIVLAGKTMKRGRRVAFDAAGALVEAETDP